ncbi:sphingosine kinase 1 isoform X4 [Bemisia tabaci]|uniref:sphingosine kinase 1 isoform X4 n=1 Tax=Bemisia tabaci TaxID=7038 RepID=UPI003B285D9E
MAVNDDESPMNPILEETFYILSKKNCVYKVKLLKVGICLQKERNGLLTSEIVLLDDIIGSRCMRSKRRASDNCVCGPTSNFKSDPQVVDLNSLDGDENDISAYLYIYAYILKNFKMKSGKKRERMTITLRFRSYDRFEDNMREAQKWRNALSHLILMRRAASQLLDLDEKFLHSPRSSSINKLLIILNPRSGMCKARDIYQQKFVPLLMEADIPFDLHVTRFHNDASEPFDENPVLVSSLNILCGIKAPLDLMRFESKSKTVFSFLSVGWGLIADIDIESERLRVLGSPRFTIWSLARIIGLRKNEGRLSFLRISDEKLQGKVHRENLTATLTRSFSDCLTDFSSPLSSYRSLNQLDSLNLETKERLDHSRRDSFHSLCSRKSTYLSAHESDYLSLSDDCNNSNTQMFGPPSQIPALTQPVPPHWTVYEGEFVMVHAVSVSHIAADCLIAPDAKMSDSVIWLIVIRAGISRTHLFQCLIGLSSGAHVNVPGVEVIPVQAFRLEPKSTGSHIVVDGELLDYEPFQVEIVPGIASVYSRQGQEK